MSDDRTVDLAALRAEYGDRGLDPVEAGADPWALWQRWFDAAAAALNARTGSSIDLPRPAGEPLTLTRLSAPGVG